MINEYEDLDIYKIKTDQKLNKKKIAILVLCILILICLIITIKHTITTMKGYKIYKLYETQLQSLKYQDEKEQQKKKEEEVLFESHREYIDLQYVIEGSEYIGLSHNATENIVLYNEEKDIAFYKADIEKYLWADSTRFFLFFPEDLHQPCMNTGQSKKVKKVVIKIRAN